MEDIAGHSYLLDGRSQLQLLIGGESPVPPTGEALEAERCGRVLGPERTA